MAGYRHRGGYRRDRGRCQCAGVRVCLTRCGNLKVTARLPPFVPHPSGSGGVRRFRGNTPIRCTPTIGAQPVGCPVQIFHQLGERGRVRDLCGRGEATKQVVDVHTIYIDTMGRDFSVRSHIGCRPIRIRRSRCGNGATVAPNTRSAHIADPPSRSRSVRDGRAPIRTGTRLRNQ